VVEIVAVKRPAARVVGVKGDGDAAHRWHQDGIAEGASSVLRGKLQFWGSEAGFHSKKPLSCSDFSHNSLRKLTGKIFRRTGNFWPVTGNFTCENPKITIRRSLAFLV
jgi:hypothetical protein